MSKPYTATVERNTKFSDRLMGLQYWVLVKRDGRWVEGTHVGRLSSVPGAIRRIILNDLVDQSLGEVQTSLDFEVRRNGSAT